MRVIVMVLILGSVRERTLFVMVLVVGGLKEDVVMFLARGV